MNQPNRDFDIRPVVERSMPWLERHYAAAVQEAASLGFFSFQEGIEEDEFEQMTEEYGGYLDFNFTEWLLAEGLVRVNGKDVRVADLLLSPHGPGLSAPERATLEALRNSPLCLFEVVHRSPAEGLLLLRDACLPAKKQTPITVYDRKASLTAVDGMKLGARVIAWKGASIFSGATYGLSDEGANQALTAIRRAERMGKHLTPAEATMLRGLQIIHHWAFDLVDGLMEARDSVIELRDHTTGDPVIFATDLYEIRDRAALEAFLDASEFIHPEPEGGGRVWLAPPWKDGISRPRAHLTVTTAGKLKSSSNTVQKADGIRAELEAALGPAIHFKARQIEDVTSEAFLDRNAGGKGPSTGQHAPEISAELNDSPEFAAAMQQHIEALYANWADEPMPAFENHTPREMLKKRGGEKRVRRMIQTYEAGANRQALDGEIPMLSYAFLYEKLGLKP